MQFICGTDSEIRMPSYLPNHEAMWNVLVKVRGKGYNGAFLRSHHILHPSGVFQIAKDANFEPVSNEARESHL
jgi:hypothetical protein